jgi:hypothetical protein
MRAHIKAYAIHLRRSDRLTETAVAERPQHVHYHFHGVSPKDALGTSEDDPINESDPRDLMSIGKGWNQVGLVRVPATSAEELPAYFELGGWHAMPESETIVAVARHWRETYAAELVAIALEFYAPRKPQDHLAAITLLKEQYVFAPDSFDMTDLKRAAAQLRASSSWVFWWDRQTAAAGPKQDSSSSANR